MAVVIAAPSFVFVSIFVTLTTARAPEQLHLSYGYSPNQMVVMWATKQDSKSRLHVRPRFIPSSDGVSKWTIVEAERWTFTNLEGNPNGLQTLHRVNLTDLRPGQTYSYYAEIDDECSNLYNFTAMRVDKDWTPQFVFYGDMGTFSSSGSPILQDLIEESRLPDTAAFFHVGDFAYSFEGRGGKNGDDFMNMIQEIAARVPYMTTAGNQDSHFNFSHYLNRFTMPTPNKGHFWYSINIGLIHFVRYGVVT
jgi:hypothetical protein